MNHGAVPNRRSSLRAHHGEKPPTIYGTFSSRRALPHVRWEDLPPANDRTFPNRQALAPTVHEAVPNMKQTRICHERSIGLACRQIWLAFGFVAAGVTVGATVGCRGAASPESLQTLRPPAPVAPDFSKPATVAMDESARHEHRVPQSTGHNPMVLRLRSSDPFAPLPPLTTKTNGANMPELQRQTPASQITPRRETKPMIPLPPLPQVFSPEPSAPANRVPSAPVRVVPPNRSPIELVGTVRGIRRRALFRSDSGMRDVAPGQVVEGWTVETIGDGTAVLVRGGVRRSLDLHRETVLHPVTSPTGNRNTSGQSDPIDTAQRKSRP